MSNPSTSLHCLSDISKAAKGLTFCEKVDTVATRKPCQPAARGVMTVSVEARSTCCTGSGITQGKQHGKPAFEVQGSEALLTCQESSRPGGFVNTYRLFGIQ
jgi:hypothetical protein